MRQEIVNELLNDYFSDFGDWIEKTGNTLHQSYKPGLYWEIVSFDVRSCSDNPESQLLYFSFFFLQYLFIALIIL